MGVNRIGKKRFSISIAQQDAPEQFFHYFIAIDGDDKMDPGTILIGGTWDGTDLPLWLPVYGYVAADTVESGWLFEYVDRVAYLGPEWQAEWKATSNEVRQSLENSVTGEIETRRFQLLDNSGGATERTPEVNRIVQRAGRWIQGKPIVELRPPIEFYQYFISTIGDDYIDPGTILVGQEWDGTDLPVWTPIYGHVSADVIEQRWVVEYIHDVTYLGEEWNPDWVELSTNMRASIANQDTREVETSRFRLVDRSENVKSRSPEVVEVLAREGAWIEEFGIKSDQQDAPDEFNHYFMATWGDEDIDPGVILRGQEWDGTDLPYWTAVYGHVSGATIDRDWVIEYVDRVAYLGQEWDPNWKTLSDNLRASVINSDTGVTGSPGFVPIDDAPP